MHYFIPPIMELVAPPLPQTETKCRMRSDQCKTHADRPAERYTNSSVNIQSTARQ